MSCAYCGGCLCSGVTKASDGKEVHPRCLTHYEEEKKKKSNKR